MVFRFDYLKLFNKLIAVALCLPLVGRSANVTVDMFSSYLKPQNLTINVGDTVTWVVQDSPRDTESYTGEWKSPLLTQQGLPFSFTFNKAGFFAYRSHYYDRYVVPGTISVSAWTNSPPGVTINSPIEGFYFTLKRSIPMLASVTNREDTVNRVDFFANTNLLGTVTNAPYNFTWTSAVEGKYALTARVTDKQGAQATSKPVNIIIEATPGDTGHIWGARLVTNGVFLLNYNYGVGSHFCLEVSDDLKTWSTFANLNTPGTYVDEYPTNKLLRFYKVRFCP